MLQSYEKDLGKKLFPLLIIIMTFEYDVKSCRFAECFTPLAETFRGSVKLFLTLHRHIDVDRDKQINHNVKQKRTRIMKKIVMTMVALLTMTAAVAQDVKSDKKAPKEPTAQEMTDRMAKALDLSDEQKAKVLALNTEYKDVLRGPGMRRGRGLRPDGQTRATAQQQPQQRKERPQMTDEQKAKMKANMEKRKEYDSKLKQILTDDQYKKFQQQHKRRGDRGGRGGRGPRPSGAPQE